MRTTQKKVRLTLYRYIENASATARITRTNVTIPETIPNMCWFVPAESLWIEDTLAPAPCPKK